MDTVCRTPRNRSQKSAGALRGPKCCSRLACVSTNHIGLNFWLWEAGSTNRRPYRQRRAGATGGTIYNAICTGFQSWELVEWEDLDHFTLARLMGHSSPAVAVRHYVHVTETHVAAGFGKFVEYQTRNVAEGIAVAFPEPSNAVEKGFFRFVVHRAVYRLVQTGCNSLTELAT